MSAAKRVAKNTSYLLSAKVSALLIGLLSSVLTVRYLGANGFGVLSFALAFTAIFGILVDFGLGTLTTREVASENPLANKYLGNVIVMRVFWALLLPS